MTRTALMMVFAALAGVALGAPAPADAAAFFARGINGCPDTGIPDSGVPVAYNASCTTSRAFLTGTASARFGHVGSSASAASLIFDSVHVGWGTDAFFSDHVVFTSSDPGARFANVAMNMILDGMLAGSGVQWGSFVAADAVLAGAISSRYSSFLTQDAGDTSTTNFEVVEALGTALLLRSPTVTVALDQPYLFSLYINTGAGGAALSEASSSFATSFSLPTGQDAFVLEEGVTVNSGNWLVNNRFVDLTGNAVPEPGTWAMIIVGFGIVGATLRRRRLQGTASLATR